MTNGTGTTNSRLLQAVCLCAISAVYLGTLGNYPVADSWVFLGPMSLGRAFSYFAQSMIPAEWDTLWLRPIPMLLFWLDAKLWPASGWGPHFINMLFHVVNAALIWQLTSLLSHRRGRIASSLPACAATLVYGLHPLTVGAVGWIAARFDVMALTFGLTGLLMWLRYADSGSRRSAAGTLAFLLLSLLSKEQGIIFLATVFLLSSREVYRNHNRNEHKTILILLGISVPVYIVWRLVIFNGLGGYLSARHGLSIMPPLHYAVAIIFPFSNIFAGWHITASMFLSIVAVIAGIILLSKSPVQHTDTPTDSILMPVLLLVFGLATTMPNPGLSLNRILDHAESRFALIGIAGAAILVGLLFGKFANSRTGKNIATLFIAIWAITATWRTGVQIQSWNAAGETAQSIVQSTVQQVPDPHDGATLIFLDIPRNNSQFAYIFGIGLKEALQLAYGRPDIRVIRFPTRDDLGNADPARDYVFRWDPRRQILEQLHAAN